MCRSVANYRYEVVNLTAYGADTGFPVTTDATLCDLRITHKYPGGRSIEVPLYDGNGVRQIDLDSASLYLRSDDILVPARGERVELSVRGKIRPTTLGVSTSHARKSSVHVCTDFSLESIVLPGMYEALCAVDDEGNRYPVGTIGLIPAAPSVEANAFAELRRSAGRLGRRGGLSRRSTSQILR